MDPPPHPSMIPASIQTATTTNNHQIHQNYPDSTNSSPRSQHIDTWDEPLPPVPGAKLRLMCSYGGHIIPRPHDKSLCYVGGDTRIVVVDRHASLSDFHSRLSQTLLNGRQFVLKYQLPNEDLDSLVSITTDEDLENMIEEYDRINSASPLKPPRLRLFLFAFKPETAASMGCLLDDAKSETWFVDALNGAGLLPRGLSDSAAVDKLLELDEPRVNVDSGTVIEAQNLTSGGNKQAINNAIQDVQSTFSDSPMVETTSSFESSVSSPSMSNLPPIKVRIDETNARLGGLDEQFSQMNVASNAQKQDDRSIHMGTSQPPIPIIVGGVGVHSGAVTGENVTRIISDDEKSDLGAPPGGPRKPPLPLQSVPRKFGDAYNLPSPDSKHAGGYNLPSPDSVASDSSIASSASLSKHTIYQDPASSATRENRIPSSGVDHQSNITDPSPLFQMQQVQETMVLPPSQQNQLQQQFIQTSAHYIQHAATGQVPVSSYYPVYAPPPQQAIHQQIDQQYPVYLLPVTQTQPYNLAVQSNIVDATSVAAARPPTPTPNYVPSTAYKEIAPQIYPAKTITTKPEVPANLYRTAGTATPTLVQVPANQFQQQYYSLSQMPPPSQSIPGVSASVTNYGYEYAHPTHDQAYYAQHPTATLPQYQTISPAAAIMLSQTSTQLATDDTSQQISSTQL
ncbi:uncharacterized protein [Coffea arabica]|uniref:PB1 domain-containing protein n=1 Tax=Coffea arabica TaxID=13443 RepID=A0ABM4U840_COFAR|nr:uncharacterized protein LOC113742067 [Coffea arabica]